MDQVNITTYTQTIKDPRLLELSKESASYYNLALKTFWEYFENNDFLSKTQLQSKMKDKICRNQLSSASYIISLQMFHTAVTSYFKAKKEYEKDSSRFSGEPKPPKKEKYVFPIYFRDDCIRVKKKRLLLTLSKGNNPVEVKWNPKLGKPIFAVITWKTKTGWQLSLSFEKIEKINDLDIDKYLSIDLGVKRTATIYDGKNTITFSGRLLKSLTQLRNKINSKTQTKLSRLKKHSIQYKKIKRANRRVIRRIDNRIKDILHKYSRTIVNHAVKKNIGKIIIGDCSGTHQNTNCGRVNNQSIVQNPDQRLRKYIKYKFENTGGTVNLIPEPYTSKTCPNCGCINEPDNRRYICKGCNFEYDRDGVGSINIYGLGQKVSLGKILGVVGSLTEPIGMKYHSYQDCFIHLE